MILEVSEHVIGQMMINREFGFFPTISQHVQVPIGTNPVEFEDLSSNFEVQAAQNSNSIVPLGLVSYQRMRGLPPKEGLSTSGGSWGSFRDAKWTGHGAVPAFEANTWSC